MVEAYGLGPTPVGGVANIGNRPTVDGIRQQLEVHFFFLTFKATCTESS